MRIADDAGHLHYARRQKAERRIDIARAHDDGGKTTRAGDQTTVVKLVLGQGRFEDLEAGFFFELDFFGAAFCGGGV